MAQFSSTSQAESGNLHGTYMELNLFCLTLTSQQQQKKLASGLEAEKHIEGHEGHEVQI